MSSDSDPVGINNLGHVAGTSQVAIGADGFWISRAFLWKDDRMQDLGALPGGTSSEAWDLNDPDQVVGDGPYKEAPLLLKLGLPLDGSSESLAHSFEGFAHVGHFAHPRGR